jgi:hypothetical protein
MAIFGVIDDFVQNQGVFSYLINRNIATDLAVQYIYM